MLDSHFDLHYFYSSINAYSIECEFKDMIMGIVDVEFTNQDNIINRDAISTIKILYERCLAVLEGIV